MRAIEGMKLAAAKMGALAVGAMALGAFAIGAIAIGRLAIGGLAVRKAKFGSVEIEDLTVRRLHVLETSPGVPPFRADEE
jgi:hypothetical protein